MGGLSGRRRRRHSAGLSAKDGHAILRLLPLIVLLIAVAAAVLLGIPGRLSWSSLAAQQAALEAVVQAHPAASLLLYALGYAALVALSIPAGTLLSVAGGLLFGTLPGAVAAGGRHARRLRAVPCGAPRLAPGPDRRAAPRWIASGPAWSATGSATCWRCG